MTTGEPFNKRNRLKHRLMDQTDVENVRKLTGSGPFLEVKYV